MEFDPENNDHWVYLAKAVDWAFGDEAGNLSDDRLILLTGNQGLLARSTLTHFRLQVRKSHNFRSAPRKLNNDVARRIWNFFLKQNRNPHVNGFAANIEFEKFRTYLGILEFFGSHPSKNKRLSKQLSGKFFIYSRSEMFSEGGYVTKGIIDFTDEADGLVIRSSEWHKYDGAQHGGGATINHYFDGYVIEKHSQIFVFAKSRHRSTPKFMIIDKRWTDQESGVIVYAEGSFMKGSYGSAHFQSRVYLSRTADTHAEPGIVPKESVDDLILSKIGA